MLTTAYDVGHKILDHPAANNGIIRHDQDGNDCVQPATDAGCLIVFLGCESTNRALCCHTSKGCLCHDHGITEGAG